MKINHIEIPSQFQRNSSNVIALGTEHTGATLINCGNELLGWSDLSGRDVLDVGCGSRFTQAIINRDLPIKSYTGIDIDEPLISYLIHNVQDSRFSFHYWHIHNALYNTSGQKLTKRTKLPVPQGKKNERYLRRIVSKAGWQVESLYAKRPDAVMQDLFLCRPKYRFGELF